MIYPDHKQNRYAQLQRIFSTTEAAAAQSQLVRVNRRVRKVCDRHDRQWPTTGRATPSAPHDAVRSAHGANRPEAPSLALLHAAWVDRKTGFFSRNTGFFSNFFLL